MRDWIKDPLLHFIVLGALIFGFFAAFGDDSRGDSRRIVVPAAEVTSIWQAMAMLYGQPPTEQELYQLIEPRIREEVMFREAVALGLDEGDSQIRQRLVEKMTFLTDDLFAAQEPTDAELAEFFDARRESFREPATVSFEQRYFSPGARGDRLQRDAEDALRRLTDDPEADAHGDDSVLPAAYADVSAREIATELGDDFAEAVFAQAPDGRWQGPLRSAFGLHLVRVSARTQSRVPALADVRERVEEALKAQRRQNANDAAYAELRDRYEIVIELPEVARERWQR